MGCYLPELVSIVMPVYNGEKYFEAALNSALSQDYDELEIIVVDDGSIDTHYVKNTCLIKQDNRIKFYRKVNGGVGSALNYAIKKASGKYISWLSHDDAYDTNKISEQIKYFKSINENKAAIYSSYKVIDENGNLLSNVDVENELSRSVTNLGPLEYGVLHGCSVLMLREEMIKIGLFREELKYVQDYEFWLRCISNGIKFHLINKPLVSSRQHKEQNGTVNNTADENYKLWQEITNYWIKEVENGYAKINSKLKLIAAYYDFFETIHFNVENVDMSGAIENLKRYEINLLNSMKVNVIIPAKKRLHETERAVLSVMAQEHKNVYITIVDDNEYQGNDSIYHELIINSQVQGNYIIVKNEQIMGVAAARNLGIEKSDSDYICFLDNDDYFTPGKIIEQLKIMLINELDFSWTSYYRNDSLQRKTYSINADVNIDKNINWRQSLIDYFPICSSTIMIKTNLAKKYLRYPEEEKIGEDLIAYINLFKSSEIKIGYINMALSFISYSKKSSSAKIENQEYFQNIFRDLLGKTSDNEMEPLFGRSLMTSSCRFGFATLEPPKLGPTIIKDIPKVATTPLMLGVSAIKKMVWRLDSRLGKPRIFRNLLFKLIVKRVRK